MPCHVNNQSSMDTVELEPLMHDLMKYHQKKVGWNNMPSAVTFKDDKENAANMLGRTAYYDPNSSGVTIYVTGRHPKDILRSLSHELVHHMQNEKGEFNDIGPVGEGYAQSNEKLREMERQAYEMGNMCFRDWEDGYKNAILESIYKHQQLLRRTKNMKMKIHEWRDDELNRTLMEKWGFKKKINEGAKEDIQDMAQGWLDDNPDSEHSLEDVEMALFYANGKIPEDMDSAIIKGKEKDKERGMKESKSKAKKRKLNERKNREAMFRGKIRKLIENKYLK